ncbi:hypothetical protein EJ07DRAFT_127802, partial [Lizonia empirigonia]
SWSRLVRFVAVEDGAEHIGEPIDASLDVGAALAVGSTVVVRAFTGSSVLSQNTQPTPDLLQISKLLLPPLAKSEIGTIRCIGLNYRKHAKEMNLDLPDHPTLFFKPSTCLGSPNAPLLVPHQATDSQADYEAGLAVVIGKAAKNASKGDAMNYVLG